MFCSANCQKLCIPSFRLQSIVAKVYGIDIELFSWFYRVKKTDVFLIAKFAAYQRCHGSPLRCGGRVRPGLSWDFYAG